MQFYLATGVTPVCIFSICTNIHELIIYPRFIAVFVLSKLSQVLGVDAVYFVIRQSVGVFYEKQCNRPFAPHFSCRLIWVIAVRKPICRTLNTLNFPKRHDPSPQQSELKLDVRTTYPNPTLFLLWLHKEFGSIYATRNLCTPSRRSASCLLQIETATVVNQ